LDQSTITLTISVVVGNAPVLNVPKPVIVPIDTTATGNLTMSDLMSGTDRTGTPWAVSATDIEDDAARLPLVIDTRSAATGAFPAIPKNTPGIYQVIYSVADSEGNLVEVPVAVVIDDGSFVYDANYVLSARSYVIGKTDVAAAEASGQIRIKSDAMAARVDGTPVAAIVLETAGYTDRVGTYQPKLGINGYVGVTRDVTATVFDNPTTPGGSAGQNGQWFYSVVAHNFRINLADAAALAAQSGSAYDNTFIARASAASYQRTSSSLPQAGTTKLYNDGGFRNGIPFAEGDKFKVVFENAQEPGTRTVINVLVSNGASPQLDVPAWKEVPMTSLFPDGAATDSSPSYMQGVSYYDNEDAEGLLRLGYDRMVNTAIPGIYEVTYRVTDTEGNYTEKKGRVLVNDGNWRMGTEYLIYAHNFTKDYLEVTGGNSEILDFSQAFAVRKSDLAVVPAVVVNDGDYQRFPGSYANVQIAAAAEPSTVRQITATVTGGQWTIAFDPNGGMLTGPSYIRVTGMGTTLPFLPQNPTRSGHEFTGWNTARNGSGVAFGIGTPINGDITVYAQWRELPAPPVTPPPAPPVVNVYPPATSPTYVEVTTPEQPPANISIEQPTQVPSTVAPITQPVHEEPKTWSLIDLLLVMGCLLALIFFVIKFLANRREEDKYGDWRESVKQQTLYINVPVLLIAVAATVEAMIILFATQVFTGNMVLVDAYTVLLSLVFFVMLITPVVAAMRKNQRELQMYQQMQYQQHLLQQQQQMQQAQASTTMPAGMPPLQFPTI
jgi:uncharacterized repeat protein (TIGR02543 family)